MSKVIFNVNVNDNNVRVEGGWDRPTQEFFLRAASVNEDEDELDVFWFDSMLLDSAARRTTAALRGALCERGIAAPPRFWALMEAREGNVLYIWDGADQRWERDAG